MIYGRKPIMSPKLERQVMNTVAMFLNRKKWKAWGLHRIRQQGAAILLVGPPGTGKTTIASYLALKVRRKGMKEISAADFGSQVPGENARQIRILFKEAAANGGMTIFIDECEAVLIDRSKLGGDMVWMIETIDELLTQIAKYPFLIILATNRPQLLDRALERRLLGVIEVPVPERPERAKLWKTKFPDSYPFHLTEQQINQIATLQVTGAEVENIIINVSSDAIRLNKKPNFMMMYAEAENTAKLRIKRDKADTES